MKIDHSAVKKRHIFFSLENALLPEKGQVIPKKTSGLLEFLHDLSEKGAIHLYLISGLHEGKAKARLDALGFSKYFPDAKFFFVTQGYIHGKAEVDRARHLESLEKDPEFLDHYFKQFTILELLGKGRISKEESVLVGNDLMFDAFYTSRFSGIDFVLVKDLLTMRGEKAEQVSGLNYISLDRGDFKKIIYDELPKNNVSLLEKKIFDELSRALVGDKIKDAVAARKSAQNN